MNSSAGDFPNHFDDLIGEADPAPAAQVMPTHKILSADDFHKIFTGGFKFARHMSGIRALEINADNEEAARGASQAFYDTILDVPALHFLLSPDMLFGKWGERGFAIAAFTVPMAMAVKAEMSARKSPPPPPEPSGPAAAQPTSTKREPGEPDALAAATLTGGMA